MTPGHFPTNTRTRLATNWGDRLCCSQLQPLRTSEHAGRPRESLGRMCLPLSSTPTPDSLETRCPQMERLGNVTESEEPNDWELEQELEPELVQELDLSSEGG